MHNYDCKQTMTYCSCPNFISTRTLVRVMYEYHCLLWSITVDEIDFQMVGEIASVSCLIQRQMYSQHFQGYIVKDNVALSL